MIGLAVAMVAAFIISGYIWLHYPQKGLLVGLASFVFVPAAAAVIGYQANAKYGELLKKERYTLTEYGRLRSIIQVRLKRVHGYIYFNILLSIILVFARLMQPFPRIASFYFALTSVLLAASVVLFGYILLSFREIDEFASKLDQRHLEDENRRRLLNILNAND